MILLFILLIHDFHVSVTNIDYDAERKAIEISMSTFADDIENAIMESGGPNLRISTDKEHPQAEKYISEYLKSHFTVTVNGKKEAFEYLGFEYERGAVWSYMQINEIRKIKTITIENTTLMEIFNDQENIIHTRINGQRKSVVLRKGKIDIELSYI